MRVRRFAPLAALLLAACVNAPGGLPATSAERPRLTGEQVRALAALGDTGCDEPGTWAPVVVRTDAAPGRTVERWQASRCGSTALVNFLVEERDPRRLDVTVLLPGRTTVPPALQPATAAAVLGRLPGNDCGERWVVDTRPTASTAELWTVQACGRALRFRVTAASQDAIAVERLPPQPHLGAGLSR